MRRALDLRTVAVGIVAALPAARAPARRLGRALAPAAALVAGARTWWVVRGDLGRW